MPSRNRVQAYIPDGAEPIDNPRGTAPGVLFEKGEKLIALMPGVPDEMKAMFEESVLPRILKGQAGPVIRSANLRCFGAGESALVERLGDRMGRGRNPLVNCTVSEGIITLQLIAVGDTAAAAESLLAEHRGQIEGILGPLVFGAGEEKLQDVVGRILIEKKKTLAVAESCTGGLVAKMLTDVPGATGFFQCGWVTYSNQAKIEQLGVSESLIQESGAVSEPVAEAMAEGDAQKRGRLCYRHYRHCWSGGRDGTKTRRIGLYKCAGGQYLSDSPISFCQCGTGGDSSAGSPDCTKFASSATVHLTRRNKRGIMHFHKPYKLFVGYSTTKG